MRTLLLTLSWFVLACAPAPATVSAREQAILGGATDAASNDVFLLDLRFDSGASICSAVLISPRVLLTAAHCVDPVFHNASTLTVRATNKANTMMLMQSDMIDVTTITRHPSWNPAVQESDFDFAAILLERAPAGVTAATLLTALPANAAGQSLRVVGYGRASASDGTSSGTRRSVTLPITRITSADLRFGSNGVAGICAGDSGGPSFLGEAVAGIHSRTEGASCGVGVDIRVDRHAAFIDAFVAANDPPSCANDGRCALGCGTSDPDCPCQADQRCDASCGLTDPDCGDDGAVCTLAAQCAGGLCVDDPRGFQFCSRPCTTSSECLNAMTCQAEVCSAPPEVAQTDPVAGGCSSAPACLGWLLLLLLLRQSKTRASRAGSPC
ncbi:MAG: S1 family peptidase [Archangium sp.]|nr:S1 family peptidase [Archangium sp.]MDP3158300.1 S1 family peptidase [Archangium sp.]MDP3571937.1 S1 family peptidase [Archangium sp.]